jgi:hypothetical protein
MRTGSSPTPAPDKKGQRVLTIIVPGIEMYDEATSTFIQFEPYRLDLEHSLVSVSKWESETEKPFLGAKEKTPEELQQYIRAMAISNDVPAHVFNALSVDNIRAIDTYINKKMTATRINSRGGNSQNKEIVTSELIYFWMISFGVPLECEHWHLNRLLMLLQVCSIKQQPQKKMRPAEAAAQQRALNAQRRAMYGTSG